MNDKKMKNKWRHLSLWQPLQVAMFLAVVVLIFIVSDWFLTPNLKETRAYENQGSNPKDIAELSGRHSSLVKLLPWVAVCILLTCLGRNLFQSWSVLNRQIAERAWIQKSNRKKTYSDDKLISEVEEAEFRAPPGSEFSRLSPEELRYLPQLIAFSATSNLHQIVMPNLDQIKQLETQWNSYAESIKLALEKVGEADVVRTSRIKAGYDSKARFVLERVFSEAKWLNKDVRRLWREEGFISASGQSVWSVQQLRELMKSVISEVEDRVWVVNSMEGGGSNPEGAVDLGIAKPSLEGCHILFNDGDSFPSRFFLANRDDLVRGILDEAYCNARSNSVSADHVRISFHYASPMIWVAIMNGGEIKSNESNRESAAMRVPKASMGLGGYFMNLAASIGGISVTHLHPGSEDCGDAVFVGLWISHIAQDCYGEVSKSSDENVVVC